MDDRLSDPDERQSVRRSLLLLGGATGMLAAASASAQSARPVSTLKIVLHVSDPDGWPPALSNAKNLSRSYPAVKVRVIADGGGVYGFQGANDLVTTMAETAKASITSISVKARQHRIACGVWRLALIAGRSFGWSVVNCPPACSTERSAGCPGRNRKLPR